MNSYTPHLDWIDSQRAEMIRRVTTWANINSGTGNVAGIEKLAADVRRDFSELGGVIETIPVRDAESINAAGHTARTPLGNAIRIHKRPDSPLRVLLCIHIDTVYSPDHAFQSVSRIGDSTLRGPGVLDAKGGLAVMLTSLNALERSGLASGLGWEVLINPDEEIGSVGSAGLLIESAKRNHLGLVFEPALPNGALVDRRKGVGNFTFVVRGRAAHAGRDFSLGRNAVVAAADLVGRLHALNSMPESSVIVNVGRLEGGGALNVVPDLAICRINVRTSAFEDQRTLQEAFGELLSQMNTRDGISAEMHGGFTSPPKLCDDPATRSLMSHIADCGRSLGIPIEWRPSGGACDGNKLAAAGLPTVDSLGPRGGDIHSPTEFLLLDSLTERARLTALLLMRLAAGEIRISPH